MAFCTFIFINPFIISRYLDFVTARYNGKHCDDGMDGMDGGEHSDDDEESGSDVDEKMESLASMLTDMLDQVR